MSQSEILEFLKKNKDKWFSAREITNNIPANSASVDVCLRKLRERNDVCSKIDNENKHMYMHMRLKL